MRRDKILFIYPSLFTFIKTEINILSDVYDLISIKQNWPNKLLLPFNLVRQCLFLLLNLHKVKCILISFAGYWSLLPVLLAKIFNKKVFIVVHGTDCVNFKQINYGSLRNPFMSFFIKYSLQFSTKILPVSKSLVYTENTYYSNSILKFGYNYHFSNITTPYSVIPNGLYAEDWIKGKIIKEKYTFITVATSDQLVRKGVELIIQAAKRFPNYTFYIAGTSSIKQFEASENVICLGKLSPKELRDWFNKTQFYLQLSNFEGFGVAICEAMLCKCIPIVSNVNFLPEIAGNPKLVLKSRNLEMFISLINNILEADLDLLALQARQRIQKKFPIKRRKEMLFSVLES